MGNEGNGKNKVIAIVRDKYLLIEEGAGARADASHHGGPDRFCSVTKTKLVHQW